MGLHLGLGLTGQRVGFNPASLFAASEPGIWLDPSDLTTLFQDTAGTTPVTAAGQTVARVNDKSGRGNNATQATAASRPTYQVDGSGRGYLAFDGVDDFLLTPTITPNIDKVQVFAGVRKLSDAAIGMLAEFGPSVNGTIGTWGHILPDTTSAGSLGLDLRGNGTSGIQRISTGTAPATLVSAVSFDLSGNTYNTERPTKKINGVVATVLSEAGSTDTGGGNFTAQALYIGMRGGTSLPFNGNIYSLVVRFGANLTADRITSTETWVNSKTGAY